MLKEIKKEKNVITNQDLFNEIIKKVKKSDKSNGFNKKNKDSPSSTSVGRGGII